MRATPNVSAVEHQIIAESLRRVASVRPDVAMVMAEILETDERELGRLAHGAHTPRGRRSRSAWWAKSFGKQEDRHERACGQAGRCGKSTSDHPSLESSVPRPEPLSHPDWLFEIKYDGFRALAYCDPSGVRLISRKGNRFSSFSVLCTSIEFALKARHAILDGEIACLDDQGYSQFNELLFRRGTARFCVFDLLYLEGKDLRDLPLIDRKRRLRKIVPRDSACLLYVDYVEEHGERMFELACERDLEGIVAKHRHSRYVAEDSNPAWIKIINGRYSQLIGRDELFERRYEAQGAPEIGLDVCDRAAAGAGKL